MGEVGQTDTIDSHRRDILAARAKQATFRLQKLLQIGHKRFSNAHKRSSNAPVLSEALSYFEELCSGPDINEYHCSLMISACKSLDQLQKVHALMKTTSVTPNAAVYTALHQSYAKLGDAQAAVQALHEARSTRTIDAAKIGGITMNTLKGFLRRGKAGRAPPGSGKRQAWQYFRLMQQADMANDRHYTKMLEAAGQLGEVDHLLADLRRAAIRKNAAIFTTLHKVYVRLGHWASAGAVLREAQQQGLLDISDADRANDRPFSIRLLDIHTLKAIATNTLKTMCAQRAALLKIDGNAAPGGRISEEDASRLSTLEHGISSYLAAIREAGLVQPAHYSVLMASSADRSELVRWLDQMDQHGIRRDERCWTIIHKSFARLGDFNAAVDTLRDAQVRSYFLVFVPTIREIRYFYREMQRTNRESITMRSQVER
eukprot:SAG31_NODE_2238_length_6119_cov_3.847508_7_plen_430_part_00